MGYNLVTNLEQCIITLPTMVNVNLLYYSHIPTILVALLIGFFVLIKNKGELSAKILFALSLTFSLWTFFDLIAWVSPNTTYIMFSWSILGVLDSLMYILSLYLVYVFIDKRDISFSKKIILGVILLPMIIMTPTRYNLGGFLTSDCTAIDNYFLNYIYFPEVIISVWIIILSVSRYIKADKSNRKQILLLMTGIILFLFSFFSAGYLTDILNNYAIEVYGLFGMVVFMGFLTYLIVRFKAFHIKLIATQALVFALIIGIGSQYFFIQDPTSRILNGITLALALVFGYILVRSVQLEVQRKEELENLSTQLAAANDKLHVLDKAKSEFISIASHQLRTPLTAIKGFVSLLLEGTYGAVPDVQKPALEKVYISNERLVQLVEDLLNISRMDSGRMEFDFQEAKIEDLVQEAVDTLDLSAKQKSLYLHWQKPAVQLPKLKIDITKIKEVISNMIDNAIKYTQKGGVTVRVEKGSYFDHAIREQKNVVRIIVSDTGIGMDKEDIDMIFNKFQRGREVSHYHTDGTGLGMYIGRKVVEAHHGRIWAESEGKNKGSRFILELPIS